MRLLLLIAIIWGFVWARKNGRLPKAFGPKPAHISARNTAIFGIGATVLIYVVSLFDFNHNTSLWQSLQLLLLPTLLFAAALGFTAWRLRRDPDEKGLAMGIAFPIAILVLLVLGVRDSYVHGSYEERSMMPLAILFAFAMPFYGLVLYVMVPTLIRLAYKSLRALLALPAGTRPNLAYVAGFALLSVVGYRTTWKQTEKLDANSIDNFRIDKTSEVIEPLYQCLWWMGTDDSTGPAFPDSLGAVRIVDGVTPLRTQCGGTLASLPKRPFTVEYQRPTKHEFRLTVTERTWRSRPVTKLWVDQTGILRRSVVSDGREDSVRVVNNGSLVELLYAQRKIEEYKQRNPRHEYPQWLSQDPPYDTVPLPPEAVAISHFRDCVDGQPNKNEICLLSSDGRQLYYNVYRDSAGRRTTYALSIASAVMPQTDYALETQLGDRFRSYALDERGLIHAYGGTRAASLDDPPPQPDELAQAQKRFEDWWGRLVEDQRRDSVGRAQWDSVRKLRADSARRE